MIWPFLFALLFVIFGWKHIYSPPVPGWPMGFMDYLMGTFFLVAFAALSFGAGLLVAVVIGSMVPKQWTGPETEHLVSLRGGNSVTGNFFLGTGSIGPTEYYFFYREAGRGYRPGKIEVGDSVLILEEKRESGELRIYTERLANPAHKWFAITGEARRYEFIIPEGSLKKNFVLN